MQPSATTARARRWACAAVVTGGAWGLLLDWQFLRTYPAYFAVPDLIVGYAHIGAGAIAWARRPELYVGPLLVADGFVWYLTSIWHWGLYLDSPVLYTLGRLGNLYVVILVYLLLTFPTNRLPSGRSRLLFWLTVLEVAVVANLPALFADSSPAGFNMLLIRDDPAAAGVLALIFGATAAVLAIAVVVTVVGRWWRSTIPARRVLGPVLLAGAFNVLIIGAVVGYYALVPQRSQMATVASNLVVYLGRVSIPAAFLGGLMRARQRRARVGEFVVDLAASPTPERLREALVRVLGDPDLEVGIYVPEANRYLTADGTPFVVENTAEDRAVTLLEREGEPVGAIRHDAALLDDVDLVDAVRAAALLAVENDRLQWEVRDQLEQVKASRARILRAADDERRRIERDIHDGAQQRLVSLSLALGLLESKLHDGSDPEVGQSLQLASKEAREALSELRDLARGIHPAVLTDEGLAAALRLLADRAAIPVTIAAAPTVRFVAAVEAAAYFVVAEALTNVAKYAAATAATVRAEVRGDHLVVTISDDGVGGADVARGTGLRGLTDRVQALEGELSVVSHPGAGTTVTARIPTGS